MNLCLTHRDILPFAQEELFKILVIESDEEMDMLNRSIASSERCKEHAGRTEIIDLGPDVDPDKLMESGAFNPLELNSAGSINFSLLSRSRSFVSGFAVLNFDSIDRSISKPSQNQCCEGTT
jgi:hypothetical protein